MRISTEARSHGDPRRTTALRGTALLAQNTQNGHRIHRNYGTERLRLQATGAGAGWHSYHVQWMERDPLTEAIIGAALRVRHHVGVGLLESAYHAFLVHELTKLGFDVLSRPSLPVTYDGIEIKAGYRPDLIVNSSVIVELKTVTTILPVHKAQLLTYLRLSQIKTGLIVNFFAAPFSDGLVRMVL